MKWLKMDCDAQENLDMRKLVDEWGWDWYGRYWAIMGKIGMLVTEKKQAFALETNNGDPFPVRLLANDLSTTVERLSAFCDFLADNRLIDPIRWKGKNLIYVPKLRERADEYTKKLLTKSRHSPDQEVDIDKKKIEKVIKENRPKNLQEVEAYFSTLGVQHPSKMAVAWWDHKEANGWKVGRNPIADWRATCRTWKNNNFDQSGKLAPIEQPIKYWTCASCKTKMTEAMQTHHEMGNCPNYKPPSKETMDEARTAIDSLAKARNANAPKEE